MKEKYEKKKEKIFEVRRLGSILLALIMLIGVFPVSSFAEGELVYVNHDDWEIRNYSVIVSRYEKKWGELNLYPNFEPRRDEIAGEVGIALFYKPTDQFEKYRNKRIKVPATIDGRKIVALGGRTWKDFNIYGVDGFYGKEWDWSSVIPNTALPIFPDVSEARYVKYIAPYAFAGLNMERLELKDMGELQRICNAAFYSIKNRKNSYTGNNGTIKNLKLSNLPKLESIGQAAFLGNNIESLTFENLHNLKRIEKDAFYNNKIKTVNFQGLPNLEKIEMNAFRRNPISGDIDFRGLNNSVEISPNAFNCTNIRYVYIKDPGKNLGIRRTLGRLIVKSS